MAKRLGLTKHIEQNIPAVLASLGEGIHSKPSIQSQYFQMEGGVTEDFYGAHKDKKGRMPFTIAYDCVLGKLVKAGEIEKPSRGHYRLLNPNPNPFQKWTHGPLSPKGAKTPTPAKTQAVEVTPEVETPTPVVETPEVEITEATPEVIEETRTPVNFDNPVLLDAWKDESGQLWGEDAKGRVWNISESDLLKTPVEQTVGVEVEATEGEETEVEETEVEETEVEVEETQEAEAVEVETPEVEIIEVEKTPEVETQDLDVLFEDETPEVEVQDAPRYVLSQLDLNPSVVRKNLPGGKVMSGSYKVAKGEGSDLILTDANSETAVVINMDTITTENPKVAKYVERVKTEFAGTDNVVEGTRTFLTLLAYCVNTHAHTHPLGGLVDACEDPDCPIHSVFPQSTETL